MKKIDIHKILFILPVFLFALFIFNNKVFASSVSELTDTDIKLVVQRGYDVIDANGYDSKDFTKYLICNQGVCYFTDNSGINTISWSGSYLIKTTNNFVVWFDFDTLESNGFADNMNNEVGNPWDMVYTKDVVYSTFDIYKGSDIVFENNIDFFRVAPQPMAEIMLVELKEKKTTAEILEVLPLIIVILVSFLGLRKALNWLLTLLKDC